LRTGSSCWLSSRRELYNLIRLSGQEELKALLDFNKLRLLHIEAQNALATLNLKQQIEQAHDTGSLLNQALEDVIFKFEKIGEAELKLADELKDTLRRTRETLGGTLDPADPRWIALKEELERLFKKKKLSEVCQDEMQANITALKDIEARARRLNHDNANLQAKYAGDAKLMRIHKRLRESGQFSGDSRLHTALSGIKQATDEIVLGNRQLLGNTAYFERQLLPIVVENFNTAPPPPDAATCRLIQQLLAREYLSESQGRLPL
jgi:type I restriction enzyme, R subunit